MFIQKKLRKVGSSVVLWNCSFTGWPNIERFLEYWKVHGPRCCNLLKELSLCGLWAAFFTVLLVSCCQLFSDILRRPAFQETIVWKAVCADTKKRCILKSKLGFVQDCYLKFYLITSPHYFCAKWYLKLRSFIFGSPGITIAGVKTIILSITLKKSAFPCMASEFMYVSTGNNASTLLIWHLLWPNFYSYPPCCFILFSTWLRKKGW